MISLGIDVKDVWYRWWFLPVLIVVPVLLIPAVFGTGGAWRASLSPSGG